MNSDDSSIDLSLRRPGEQGLESMRWYRLQEERQMSVGNSLERDPLHSWDLGRGRHCSLRSTGTYLLRRDLDFPKRPHFVDYLQLIEGSGFSVELRNDIAEQFFKRLLDGDISGGHTVLLLS